LSRLYQPNSGTVDFDGKDLLDTPAHKIVRLGLARTFPECCPVPGAHRVENATGAHRTVTWASDAPAAHRCGLQERKLQRHCLDPLERLDLAQLAHRWWPACRSAPSSASSSPGAGHRAQAADVDEPANGLTHGEVDELGDTIRLIRDQFDSRSSS
jgi:branched-chain amino acid transport system ATP-binding protein